MEWIRRFKHFFRDTKKHLSEERPEREIWNKSGRELKSFADQVGDRLKDHSKSASEQADLLSSSLGERLIRAGEEIELWFQRQKSAPQTASPSNISTHAGYTSISRPSHESLFEEDSSQEDKADSSSGKDEIPESSHQQKLNESEVDDEFYRKAERFAGTKGLQPDDKDSQEEKEVESGRYYGFEDGDIDEAELDEEDGDSDTDEH